jgi:hypothetical protein
VAAAAEAYAPGTAFMPRRLNKYRLPPRSPIVFEGKLIGGVGASGGTGQEDTATVEAGVAALKQSYRGATPV